MASKRDIAAAIILLDAAGVFKKKKRKKRQCWVNNFLLKRDTLSDTSLLNKVNVNDTTGFRHYLRMTDKEFGLLLSKVSPLIEKKNTTMRAPIPPEDRLAATLGFLATGRSFEDLKFCTAISAQALGRIIPETCKAIYSALKEEYMKFPSTAEEWMIKSFDFQHQWNFPNCGGAIGGKHIAIVYPSNSGPYYHNYQGFHSLMLLAVVDANHQFIHFEVDVGCKDSKHSDGADIEMKDFYSRLKNGELSLPNKGTVAGLNFVFLGDSAFSLRPHLMTSFSDPILTHAEWIFNYRFSRAHRVVENALGILANRFRILLTTICLRPNKVEDVICACIVLHNFLCNHCGSDYISSTAIDREDIKSGLITEGDWRHEPVPDDVFANLKGSVTSLNDIGNESRNQYKEYFNTIGQVPWQDKVVKNRQTQ